MPSSRAHTIPWVIEIVRRLRPHSILDVGVGFGKWGHLFREYTDIAAAEHDPQRYSRERWQVRIDGIEGHAPYLTEMHKFLYNHLYQGNAYLLMPGLPAYDLIFMGDIIEHVPKEQGRQLLSDALTKALKAVVVTTPKFNTGQEDSCGNELERHRSLWSARDFRRYPGATVRTIEGMTLLAVFVKGGAPRFEWGSRQSGSRAGEQSMNAIKSALMQWIPVEAPFILVDDQQLHGLLPHTAALPFLERDGLYWGAPATDREAIDELERLKSQGAGRIAFVAPTYWWLDRYPAFARHLRERYRLVHEDQWITVFELNP